MNPCDVCQVAPRTVQVSVVFQPCRVVVLLVCRSCARDVVMAWRDLPDYVVASPPARLCESCLLRPAARPVAYADGTTFHVCAGCLPQPATPEGRAA